MAHILNRTCIPVFLKPWLSRFYSRAEIDLINALGEQPMTADEVHSKLNPHVTDRFLHRAWRRGVVECLEDGSFTPADFHARFEIWALFEGWQDLPADIMARLNRWELDAYIAKHLDTVNLLKAGGRRPTDKPIPEYLLLDEVARLFARIPCFYLWPCNCRAMMRQCSQPQLTCIRFSNTRGIGWEISRERALSIVHEANRQGLMQSVELAVDNQGRFDGALCNCCNDCCFPHQLARELKAEKIWPLSRYQAQLTSRRCNSCGRCVRRCPFGAITQLKEHKGRSPEPPGIDTNRCRGCGVCATGCQQGAIDMQQIRQSIMGSYYT